MPPVLFHMHTLYIYQNLSNFHYSTTMLATSAFPIFITEWKTQPFNITSGVFHGGTLSQLQFLIAFNPIIRSVAAHPSKGFVLGLPNQAQASFPAIPNKESHTNSLWEDQDSNVILGWYLANVLAIVGSGNVTLKFMKGWKA